MRTLTLRQRDVVSLIAEGRTMKEIAATLGLSPRTVELTMPDYEGVRSPDHRI